MKIYITSNTHFGYKGMIKNQLSYFNDIIIPYLKENCNEGDIFIHGGNIFNNKKNVALDIINDVMDIFESISKIIPIYILKSENDNLSILLLKRIKNINIIDNKKKIGKITLIPSNSEIDNEKNIVIFNHNYYDNPDIYKKLLNDSLNICTYKDDFKIRDGNIINIGSPYELSKDNKYKKGFLVIDTDKKKHKFVENKFSPRFIIKTIDNEDDIKNFDINIKNYIYLNINEKLIEKKENLNKLNLLINKYNFKNITYLKNNDTENDNFEINSDDFKIKDIINDYIKNNNINISEELETIYKIYSEKY